MLRVEGSGSQLCHQNHLGNRVHFAWLKTIVKQDIDFYFKSFNFIVGGGKMKFLCC